MSIGKPKPGWLREFCDRVTPLGFAFDGYTGTGHPRFVHNESGAVVTASLTPSDFRSERNCLADMERISGRKLARDNAGHYKVRRVQRSDFRKTAGEVETAAEVDALVATAESMRRRFHELTAVGTRAAAEEARRLIVKFDIYRDELAKRHRHIDPLTAVAS